MNIDMDIDPQLAWKALTARDRSFDGRFVFAVATTGIYCRPSCPSRRPNQENVSFFDTAEAAERSRFRPCLRCRPTDTTPPLAERARVLIDENIEAGITLEQLAAATGSSAHHLQRTFKKAFGISPKKYLSARRSERFKEALRDGQEVAAATYEAGYGSSSRVYSSASERLGMTPARYRKRGEAIAIRFLTAPVAAGTILVAWTGRGICAVTLGDDAATLEAALRDEFPAAELARCDGEEMSLPVREVIARLDRGEMIPDVPLDVRATLFQMQVWDALRQIPRGETRTYSQIAAAIGRPKSVRAVANACAANQVAVAIPCHRVIREDGKPGGYRWGVKRKRELLERERLDS